MILCIENPSLVTKFPDIKDLSDHISARRHLSYGESEGKKRNEGEFPAEGEKRKSKRKRRGTAEGEEDVRDGKSLKEKEGTRGEKK